MRYVDDKADLDPQEVGNGSKSADVGISWCDGVPGQDLVEDTTPPETSRALELLHEGADNNDLAPDEAVANLS
jgi:hypothetical protein